MAWYGQDACPSQAESGAAIHLALDSLESVDVTFDLAVAPGSFDGGNDHRCLSSSRRRIEPEAHTGLSCHPYPMQHAVTIFARDRLMELHG